MKEFVYIIVQINLTDHHGHHHNHMSHLFGIGYMKPAFPYVGAELNRKI